ncbi:MAG: hypothetical protein NTV51_20385 [Verrucomicrobia bacterium]|nr:hypothetical protein [Verrucomicrobiota bacterium]
MSLFGSADSSQSPDSGKLCCDAGQIHYSSATFGSWSVQFDSISIIGEYTNQNGPYLDDYFLIFVGESRQEWWEASFYADGRDPTLSALERTFPGVSQLGLCGSTSFESHVLWPPKHHGKPLFVFSKPQRPPGLLGRVMTALDATVEHRIADGLD